MTIRDLVFEVHYGGKINRGFTCTYVGGEVDVHDETYDEDKLSFFEIEGIVKNYGYKSGDLVYYLQPGCTLQGGLKLISSDHNVLEMVAAHKGVPVIELYLVSFDEPAVNDDEDDDDNDDGDGEHCENSRIDRDDPYWEEVFEPDLFDEDSNLPGPSTAGGNVEEGGVEGNDEGDGEGNEGEDGDEDNDEEGDEDRDEDNDEEGESDEAAEDDNENANARVAKKGSGGGQCYGDEVDGDEANSDMARSDILVSPPRSDEENEVSSVSRFVTRRTEFQPTDMSNPQLSNGQVFPSIKVFREAIRENNLKKGKDVRFKKNYLAKCIVVCRDPRCRYRVYGRKSKDQESFQIISIQDKHTCTRQHRNSTVKSAWIADKLIDKFRVQPNMPLKAILGEVKDKWGVDVNNCQLYRARRIAKEMLQGKVKLQYNKLWDYCETVRQTNRGSCVMMKVERPLLDYPSCFQRLYFSLAAMKKGFRAGCRPIIGLDGCFLKGTYKGQLLSAISRDGNNNIYPVALAVVEAETKDSWIWFLETLLSDLGTPPAQGWTFISDRQKGLQPAFDVVLPGGDHRFCVRHLYANFRDAGHRGLALKDKLWAAAAAYTEAEFYKAMDELKHISEDAHNYLSNVDPSSWSRAWFNTFPRCDLLVNNLCECFNAYILNARDLPIISMLEFIRKKLMKRYQTKRDGIRTMTGTLCPRVVAKLDEIGQVAGHCYSTYAGDGLYEVTHNNKQYVVNLLRKTCGCRQWDMTGIPCAHAMSAIWFFNANPEDYVDDWYSIEMYKKAYDEIVYPMPGEDQWVKTNCDKVDPPISRIQPGRPRKVRTRGPEEPVNQYRMRKGGVRMRCSKCRGVGHNSRTCPRNRTEAVNYRRGSSSRRQHEVQDDSGRSVHDQTPTPQPTIDAEIISQDADASSRGRRSTRGRGRGRGGGQFQPTPEGSTGLQRGGPRTRGGPTGLHRGGPRTRGGPTGLHISGPMTRSRGRGQFQGTVHTVRLYGPSQHQTAQSQGNSTGTGTVNTVRLYGPPHTQSTQYQSLSSVNLSTQEHGTSHLEGTPLPSGSSQHSQQHLGRTTACTSAPARRGKTIVPTVDKAIAVMESNKRKRKKPDWQKY